MWGDSTQVKPQTKQLQGRVGRRARQRGQVKPPARSTQSGPVCEGEVSVDLMIYAWVAFFMYVLVKLCHYFIFMLFECCCW